MCRGTPPCKTSRLQRRDGMTAEKWTQARRRLPRFSSEPNPSALCNSLHGKRTMCVSRAAARDEASRLCTRRAHGPTAEAVAGVSVPTGLPPCPGLRGEPCRTYQAIVNRVVKP